MTERITLEKFVNGGQTLGRWPDGRAVFVPFALPGETVLAEPIEEKQSFVRARLAEVLEAAPGRQRPRCRHFGECGGCHYQHLSYEAQLALKTELVRDQLTRIAGVAEPQILPILPSPHAFNYRNALQFHPDADGRLGFLAAYKEGILPVTECHLPDADILDVWNTLDFELVPGIHRVELRSDSRGEMVINLTSDQTILPELMLESAASVVLHNPTGQILLAGDDYLLQEVKDIPFVVSASSFFQVNSTVAGTLVDEVMRMLQPQPQETIFDLYSGVGLFSAFIAPQCSQLVGIEGAPSACDDYARNLDAYEHVSLYEGLVEDILPHLTTKPDAVVLDPPRAGLKPQVIDALANSAPERIVYVSCDPATLARDVKRFIAHGYQLESARPVDMFPQTGSIETVVLLRRQPL